MKESSVDVLARLRAHQRVVVHFGSVRARWVGALAVFCAACWLISLLARNYRHENWQAAGRLAWSLTVLAAVALIARGIFLGRPVTAMHAAAAAGFLVVGLGAHVLSFDLLGDVLIAGSGLVLMWSTAAHPRQQDLLRVWALISATQEDPLAPFAMQTGKCYHFSADGSATLAFRTRMGFAVVSGDPVGDETQFRALVADFAAMCHTRGWRMVVIGCSERRLDLWTDPAVIGQALRAIPIGRDVVIDVSSFEMVGRRFRNLRQAVRRTHNAGITTEIVAEQALDDEQRAELTEVLVASPKGSRTDRGFCMNLDGVLEGRFPGVQLIIARDASGKVQGFDRFTTAGAGSDISLDVPWRRRGAPNGLDERLTIDMIEATKNAGGQRVSLAFAAFPELFEESQRSWLHRVFYRLIHVLDPLIALESLYRYLRKFHAMDCRRYALVTLRQLVPLMFVLLSLEFMPRRRHL
ncbi:bifunctional lysylphosphatidylglycerol flippase/synthetase MprF [Mycobacterium szulgai]|uniref:Phosphatidylglycerol lysyltransferase C-terminal domain-containing protein n=1 Tax=Mycobacterium szulgai TaxID=1787 RepID=A0A1X2DNR3_MYCSZ|nr:phosphatidylglycerol lysyltransferase domain-containing protein [Mycobacterium szulgai]MCV7074577.1 DUF2156 domain-containing protein [Mycobacterium szulgai]ORW89801.1 hypothetical protein AWC27_12555 [Mycobacterium szulgai]